MILASLVLASDDGHHNVALQTLPAGLIGAAAFLVLGLVTLSYRNVSNRHAAKAEAFAARNGVDSHGAGH